MKPLSVPCLGALRPTNGLKLLFATAGASNENRSSPVSVLTIIVLIEDVADLPKVIVRELTVQARNEVEEIAVVGAFAVAGLNRSVADGIKPLAEDRRVRDGIECLEGPSPDRSAESFRPGCKGCCAPRRRAA